MPDYAIAPTFPVHLQVASRATVAQLAQAVKDRAPVPEAVDPERLIFWTALASNNSVDSYSTYMGTSTLRNFAEDAKNGVSFQDGHLTDGAVRTLGQSLMARYSGPNAQATAPGVASVEIDFFGERGIEPSLDATLRKMEIGVLRDVSVGFNLGQGGFYRCTICDRDMFDFADYEHYCPHVPGMRYPTYDKQGKPTAERVTATAEIVDARLSEVSAVYDGATAGASILVVKARQLSDAGKLDPERARVLEARYRINLPGAHRAFAGFTPSKEAPVGEVNQQPNAEERATPQTDERAIDERIRAATGAREGEIRAALASVGLSCEGDDLLAAIRTQGAALTELRARADDGKAYRTDLLAEALAEGVRANGEGFAEETYRGILAAAPLDAIKRMRDDWKGIAAKTFPGGRQSSDAGGDGDKGARSQEPEDKPASTIDPRMVARFRTPGR